jgi:hypothetical protein
MPHISSGVRVEIMGSHKCRIAGKSQSVLIMINPIIFTRTRTVHCHRRRAFEVLTTRTTITQAQPRGSGRRCHLRTASVATGILHCLRFAYGLGTGILNYDDAEQVAAESWSNPSGEIDTRGWRTGSTNAANSPTERAAVQALLADLPLVFGVRVRHVERRRRYSRGSSALVQPGAVQPLRRRAHCRRRARGICRHARWA